MSHRQSPQESYGGAVEAYNRSCFEAWEARNFRHPSSGGGLTLRHVPWMKGIPPVPDFSWFSGWISIKPTSRSLLTGDLRTAHLGLGFCVPPSFRVFFGCAKTFLFRLSGQRPHVEVRRSGETGWSPQLRLDRVRKQLTVSGNMSQEMDRGKSTRFLTLFPDSPLTPPLLGSRRAGCGI